MLKGVLFDLGDTLQDFEIEDWEALNQALNRDLYRYLAGRGYAHKLPPLDEFIELMNTSRKANFEEVRRTRRGKPLLEILRPVLAERGIADLRAEECLLPWYNRVTDHINVKPDVKPTLQLLHAGGLKLGLVSNTAWPATAHDPDLERFGIKDLLQCRLYSCEVGWEKPAPQIFEEALRCIKLQAKEVAFVGDFLRYDVAGAQAVGMKGIWKRVPGRPEEVDDHSITPDATIASLSELPGALEKLYGWRPQPQDNNR